jgi:hypothetical protein
VLEYNQLTNISTRIILRRVLIKKLTRARNFSLPCLILIVFTLVSCGFEKNFIGYSPPSSHVNPIRWA